MAVHLLKSALEDIYSSYSNNKIDIKDILEDSSLLVPPALNYATCSIGAVSYDKVKTLLETSCTAAQKPKTSINSSTYWTTLRYWAFRKLLYCARLLDNKEDYISIALNLISLLYFSTNDLSNEIDAIPFSEEATNI